MLVSSWVDKDRPKTWEWAHHNSTGVRKQQPVKLTAAIHQQPQNRKKLTTKYQFK